MKLLLCQFGLIFFIVLCTTKIARKQVLEKQCFFTINFKYRRVSINICGPDNECWSATYFRLNCWLSSCKYQTKLSQGTSVQSILLICLELQVYCFFINKKCPIEDWNPLIIQCRLYHWITDSIKRPLKAHRDDMLSYSIWVCLALNVLWRWTLL